MQQRTLDYARQHANIVPCKTPMHIFLHPYLLSTNISTFQNINFGSIFITNDGHWYFWNDCVHNGTNDDVTSDAVTFILLVEAIALYLLMSTSFSSTSSLTRLSPV